MGMVHATSGGTPTGGTLLHFLLFTSSSFLQAGAPEATLNDEEQEEGKT